MGVDAEIYIAVPDRPTKEQIKRWSWDLGNVFGHWRVFNDEQVDAIEIDDDCFEIPRNTDGRTMLRIWTGTRFYGPSYQRGDLMVTLGIVFWAKRKFPGCPVLYGGDCGVGHKEMTEEYIDELLSLYLDHGHIAYDSSFGDRSQTEAPVCERCACGEFQPQMCHCGAGPEWELWRCIGCGKEVERGARAYKTGHTK